MSEQQVSQCVEQLCQKGRWPPFENTSWLRPLIEAIPVCRLRDKDVQEIERSVTSGVGRWHPEFADLVRIIYEAGIIVRCDWSDEMPWNRWM